MASGVGLSRAIRTRLAATDVYYGWFIVGACFVSAMVTYGTIYSFGTFFSHILAEFGQTFAGTSLIFSLQSVVMFTSAALLGFFIDRYGARRLFPLGGSLIVLGLLGASQLPWYLGVVISYGGIAAVGFAITYVIAYATVPRWFDRRKGFATGIATSGTGAGLLIISPFASFLIDLSGWRTAYFLLMLVFLVLLLLAWSVIADKPSDLGVDVSAEFADDNPEDDSIRTVSDQLENVTRVARSPTFALLFIGLLFVYVPFYVLIVYLVEFATNVGVGREVGVLAVSLIGGVSIAGRFTVGFLADRFGIIRLYILSTTIMGGTVIVLAFGRVPLVVLALAVSYGIGYGGAGALMSPLITEFFGRIDINTVFGMTNIAFAIAGSAVPYLAGVGYDLTQTFVLIFVGSGVTALIGTGLILVASITHS